MPPSAVEDSVAFEDIELHVVVHVKSPEIYAKTGSSSPHPAANDGTPRSRPTSNSNLHAVGNQHIQVTGSAINPGVGECDACDGCCICAKVCGLYCHLVFIWTLH